MKQKDLLNLANVVLLDKMRFERLFVQNQKARPASLQESEDIVLEPLETTYGPHKLVRFTEAFDPLRFDEACTRISHRLTFSNPRRR